MHSSYSLLSLGLLALVRVSLAQPLPPAELSSADDKIWVDDTHWRREGTETDDNRDMRRRDTPWTDSAPDAGLVDAISADNRDFRFLAVRNPLLALVARQSGGRCAISTDIACPSGTGCCPPDKECCGTEYCSPLGGDCCGDGTACKAGYKCTVVAGQSKCCKDFILS